MYVRGIIRPEGWKVSIKLDAVVLSWKRCDNLEQIVGSLKEQGIFNNVYIWHNSPSQEKIEGAVNIFSEKNFDTYIRHIFALALDSDYVLFQDDDLILDGDNSSVIMKSIRKYGDTAAVMGPFGKKYLKKQDSVVILGRMHIVKREYLIYPLLFEKEYNYKRDKTIGDDIFLNLSIQHFTKKESIIIQDLKTKNLPEGDCAKAIKKRWWEKRKRVARKILNTKP